METKPTKTSTIFLSSVTVIDGAVISPDGFPVGMSFNPSFEITGVVEGDEQVVVDFSRIKKLVKQYIDDKIHGVDHKLWIDRSWSEFADLRLDKEANKLELVTDRCHLIGPADMVVVYESGCDNFTSGFELYLKKYLEDALLDDGIQVDIVVHADLTHTTLNGVTVPEEQFFHYTHGLRNSTSWGCQSIMHGHISYVAILNKQGMICSKELACDIAMYLNQAYFVHEVNLQGECESGQQKEIAYSSLHRGDFKLTLKNVPVMVMREEVTIENIVDMVCEKFGNRLREEAMSEGAKMLLVSEGLTKGSSKLLDELFQHDPEKQDLGELFT